MPSKRMYCPTCGDYRRADSPGASHVLHLLLSLLSCGLWVPIWFMIGLTSNYCCAACGSRARPAESMTLYYIKVLLLAGVIVFGAVILAIIYGVRTA